MPISLRLLRAAVQERLDQRFPLSSRDLDRQEAILEFAEVEMATYGRQNLSLTRFAAAIRLSPGAVKRLFADLDALLASLIRRHLIRLSRTLGDIPRDMPDRPQKLRATYLANTRKPFGGFTDAHLLYVRDRHLLPEDERATIELMRDSLAQTIGGEFGEAALDLLDAPSLTGGQIEFFIERLPEATRQPAPETPPPAEPKLVHNLPPSCQSWPGSPPNIGAVVPEKIKRRVREAEAARAARREAAGAEFSRRTPAPLARTPPAGPHAANARPPPPP